MKPYPWHEARWFNDRRVLGQTLTKYVGAPLAVIATVISLGITLVVAFIARQRFKRVNDSWAKRGLLMVVLGVVASLLLRSPFVLLDGVVDLLFSFGDKARTTTSEAVKEVLVGGVPIGFVLHGIAMMIDGYCYEYEGERYIEPTKPTLSTKRRKKNNTKALSHPSARANGWLRFGVVVNDPIPWRTARYGMVVERPLEKSGHAIVLGTNGAGKSVLATSLAYQAASSGASVLYVDYKASPGTYQALRGAAAAAGVPFRSLALGINASEQSWYDPLDWGDSGGEVMVDSSPSDRASLLVQSFEFSEVGDARYYRDSAEQWMTLQFKVLDAVGKKDGESTLDFLLDTSSPYGMEKRLKALKQGTDAQKDQFTEWTQTIKAFRTEQLSSLRNNLSNVVNAGGQRLRPTDGVEEIDLGDLSLNGGVCYIGLSPAVNQAAVRIVGSLILRDLSRLAHRRENGHVDATRPMVAMVDEASRMGDKTSVMNDVFAMARSGGVGLWVFTQSLGAWPEETVREMWANFSTVATFRVQDKETAKWLSESLGTIPAMSEMSEATVEHRVLRGKTVRADGDARRQISRDTMLTPEHFSSDRTLPNRHAHIWFTGSVDRPTRKKWKSGRVRSDDIGRDAPLVEIVAPDVVLNPPAEEIVGQSFAEMTSAFADQFADRDVVEAPATTPQEQEGLGAHAAGKADTPGEVPAPSARERDEHAEGGEPNTAPLPTVPSPPHPGQPSTPDPQEQAGPESDATHSAAGGESTGATDDPNTTTGTEPAQDEEDEEFLDLGASPQDTGDVTVPTGTDQDPTTGSPERRDDDEEFLEIPEVDQPADQDADGADVVAATALGDDDPDDPDGSVGQERDGDVPKPSTPDQTPAPPPGQRGTTAQTPPATTSKDGAAWD